MYLLISDLLEDTWVTFSQLLLHSYEVYNLTCLGKEEFRDAHEIT